MAVTRSADTVIVARMASTPAMIGVGLMLIASMLGLFGPNKIVAALFAIAAGAVLSFMVFAREEVRLSEVGAGTITVRRWKLTGKSTYSHDSLSKVARIVVYEYGGDDTRAAAHFLEFSDGSKLLLPDDKRVPTMVKDWLREVYGREVAIEGSWAGDSHR